MNSKQYKYDAHLCTCQNQAMLTIGSTCEVCMGTVANPALQDPTKRTAATEVFDEAYFEALESFYEDITYAA